MSDIDAVIYRNIFTRLMEPICIIGADRIIINANESLELLIGHEEKSLIGKEVGSIFTEESLELLDMILGEGQETKEWIEEFKLRRTDGTSIIRNIKIFSVKDSHDADIFCLQIPVIAQKDPWLSDIFDLSKGKYPEGLFDGPISTLQGEMSDVTEPFSSKIEPRNSEALAEAPIPAEFTQPIPVSIGSRRLVNDIDELLRSLSVWSDEGMVTTDTDGKITSHNDTFREWVGYNAEEIDKKPIIEFLGEEYRGDMERIIEGLSKGESIKGIRSELVHKDRSKWFITLNAMAIKDGKEEISGFIVIMQKAGAMGRQKILLKLPVGPSLDNPPVVKSVVDLVKEGIVVTDVNHAITGLNSVMEEIIGIRSRKRRGKDLLKLFPSLEREWAAEIIKRIEEQGEIEKQPVSLLHGNGSSIPANIDGSLIEDPNGGKVGIMLVVRVEKKKIPDTSENDEENEGEGKNGKAETSD